MKYTHQVWLALEQMPHLSLRQWVSWVSENKTGLFVNTLFDMYDLAN